MKAIVYEKYGSPDVLQLQEMATPVPRDNQVLVKVKATSLNAPDWRLLRADPFLARLNSGLFKPKYPILGFDIAGTVQAVGKNVTQFKIGDAVFGNLFETGYGGRADFNVPSIRQVDALIMPLLRVLGVVQHNARVLNEVRLCPLDIRADLQLLDQLEGRVFSSAQVKLARYTPAPGTPSACTWVGVAPLKPRCSSPDVQAQMLKPRCSSADCLQTPEVNLTSTSPGTNVARSGKRLTPPAVPTWIGRPLNPAPKLTVPLKSLTALEFGPDRQLISPARSAASNIATRLIFVTTTLP